MWITKKTDICQSKIEWECNMQNVFDKARAIIKDACMKFYDETKPLYTQKQMYLELD